jgi:hypothetical protein
VQTPRNTSLSSTLLCLQIGLAIAFLAGINVVPLQSFSGYPQLYSRCLHLTAHVLNELSALDGAYCIFDMGMVPLVSGVRSPLITECGTAPKESVRLSNVIFQGGFASSHFGDLS